MCDVAESNCVSGEAAIIVLVELFVLECDLCDEIYVPTLRADSHELDHDSPDSVFGDDVCIR